MDLALTAVEPATLDVADDCTLRAVASALGTSARTLQRRLRAEGTSFDAIVDEVRREMASSLLERGVPLKQIAMLLGYAATSAFHPRVQALDRREPAAARAGAWHARPASWRAGSMTVGRDRESMLDMSTAARASAAVPASDTAFYFSIAFLLTWLPLVPPSLAALGVLSGPPENYMAGAPLAVLSPTIAAVLAARREGGWPAVRALLRGLRAWRVSPIWFVLALASSTLLYTAGRAVVALVPGIDGGAWMYPPEQPQHFAAVLIVPLCEEIGWRGFALPRLIARHGAHRATAILGLAWGLWHIPMFLSASMTMPQVLLGIALVALGNVSYTWLYRRTGGSLLLAVLLHVGAHLDNPTHALPGSATPLGILTVAYAVLTVALLVLDRRAFEGTSVEAPR